MIKIKYKSKQEKILIKNLSLSSFITEEMLYDIKKYYNKEVPYHNFLHALQVSSEVLRLNLDKFNILEIKSLFFAALFHDAGHSWQANLLDEFRSLDIALQNLEEFEKKYDIWFIDKTIIRKAIIWTVFAKRWKFTDKFARIMWDLDVWVIGWDFIEFCYYGFPFCYELNQTPEEYITKTEINYFKYLMSFDKQVLLTQEVKEILPNSLKNIKKFINTDKKILIEMCEIIKNEDISLEEFEERFKNKV